MYQISISFSSEPSITPFPSLFLSVSRWVWGFAVKCVGGEKKEVFSVQKNDNLSFFSLGSQPVEMDLLPAVSQSVSRNVFYSVSRSQWGHAVGTTPWPGPLSPSASVPIRFPPIFLAPHTIWSMLFTLPLWSRRWRTLCALLSSFPASLTVRHTNYEKLESGSLTPKITCTKTATKGFEVFHLFTLQHREILVDFDTWTSLRNDPLCITRLNSYFKYCMANRLRIFNVKENRISNLNF